MRSTNPIVKKMLGRNPFSIGKRAFGDMDGDGVSNILDCEPRNPKKQGLTHRLAKKAAGFIPGKLGEEAKGAISHREDVADARRKAAREEEIIQAGATAKFKVQEREKRKRAFVSGGGAFGSLGRGLAATAKAVRGPPIRRVKQVGKKKKGKRSKTAIKRAVQSAPEPKRIPTLSDLKFEF